MEPIPVLVHGALGKMGQAICAAVARDPELRLVGGVDIRARLDRMVLPEGAGEIPLSADLKALMDHTSPQVMVDFTQHEAVMPAARIAMAQGVHLVIGTTGLADSDLEEIAALTRKHGVGAVVAANFSLGAVLMMHLARIAGKYFDYAEIIEMHHEQKLDSPSGTAVATAKGMFEARGRRPFIYPQTHKESVPGARGAVFEGIALHSVRSPGYMAHQEVILGGMGQTLKIRHDQISREGFGPGVTLAIKEVIKSKGLIVGLDKLLGL